MPTVFIPRETRQGETRVAATPDSVKRLIKLGLSVEVETNAGRAASFSDAEYRTAGAKIVSTVKEGLETADIFAKVNPPTPAEVAMMKSGASFIGHLWPVEALDLVKQMADLKIDAFAMDAIPRITRAQKHDALSSQTNLAGYKAVLIGASKLPKIFPMLMTAAGTTKPARVVVLGAGVAGLQAIATAKRLGAIVEVSDVRPEVKEQVQSLGGTYIEVKSDENLSDAGGYAKEQTEEFKARQQQVLREHIVRADVVITTALIPYRPAPVLIKADVVAEMRRGSVIVDLAAERGGNCELTKAGETIVTENGVTVVGELNLPATLPVNASELYSKNVENVIEDAVKRNKENKGQFIWDLGDEVVAGALIVKSGEVRHGPTREKMGLGPLPKPAEAETSAA
jgi:NAD(P) transhydrogenase subunit alpha